RALVIVDPPPAWQDVDDLISDPQTNLAALNLSSAEARHAAIFYPRVQQPDPLRDGKIYSFAPCGVVAGVMARTDASRGVWKAPAGLEASLTGVFDLTVPLTNAENGELNPLGINCLRKLPAAGNVVWGARTLVGDDRLASQWKYIPVRRTTLFIE